MSHSWRHLRVGDTVRIVRVPSEFSLPGYHVADETIALYRHLIAEGCVLSVSEIDEAGLPRIEYNWEAADGLEYHTLAINDDSWEPV